jgi:uncharacterized protein YoxC
MAMVDIFVKRVQAALKDKSKEVKINTNDAQQLVMEITGLLSRENELLNKIANLQEKLLQKPKYYGKVATPNSTPNDIAVDGGKFK